MIGGGLPVGAYGGRREIMELVAPAGPVYQAGTLSGNPLAMTAGIATLRALGEPGVWDGLERAAERLAAGLRRGRSCGGRRRAGRTGGVDVRPLLRRRARSRTGTDAEAADTARFAAFHRAMLERGVYLAPSQFEAGFVSTAHGDAEIDATLAAAREAFGKRSPELYASRPVKVLLVTMYFPPAGGGGVQRPLKLAQYLPALGIETHVLAPDDPKWVHRDAELRVPTQAWVHRARYLGPRARKPAEELQAADGLERALVQVQCHLAAAARPRRERELEPDRDPRRDPDRRAARGSTWWSRRRRRARSTSSGAAVQRATGARWVADLRDPLVANPHRRDDTVATRARQATNAQLARLVARHADAISCVSEAIADEMRALDPQGPVRTIANGCDFDDFAGLEYEPAPRFRITHTGSFFGKRDPRPFLQALADSASTSSSASSATSARPTASGRSRSVSATASSSSATRRGPSRSGSSASRRRSCSSFRTRAGGARACSRGRSSSISPPAVRSSRSSRRTERPPT